MMANASSDFTIVPKSCCLQKPTYFVFCAAPTFFHLISRGLSWHFPQSPEPGKLSHSSHAKPHQQALHHPITHNGVRVESIRPYVCFLPFLPGLLTPSMPLNVSQTNRCSDCNSYNKYLSVAARVVRRSLKDDKRLQAERRGEMELRFAKWSVSTITSIWMRVWRANGVWGIERQAGRRQECCGCKCSKHGRGWRSFELVEGVYKASRNERVSRRLGELR